MDVLINQTGEILSKGVFISNHLIVHFEYSVILFVNYPPKKLKKKNKEKAKAQVIALHAINSLEVLKTNKINTRDKTHQVHSVLAAGKHYRGKKEVGQGLGVWECHRLRQSAD